MNKNNNFDFLRFLFSLLVVISHSYPLSGGNESSQWIYQITNGQIVLAQIGLSGLLLATVLFAFVLITKRGEGTYLSNYFKV